MPDERLFDAGTSEAVVRDTGLARPVSRFFSVVARCVADPSRLWQGLLSGKPHSDPGFLAIPMLSIEGAMKMKGIRTLTPVLWTTFALCTVFALLVGNATIVFAEGSENIKAIAYHITIPGNIILPNDNTKHKDGIGMFVVENDEERILFNKFMLKSNGEYREIYQNIDPSKGAVVVFYGKITNLPYSIMNIANVKCSGDSLYIDTITTFTPYIVGKFGKISSISDPAFHPGIVMYFEGWLSIKVISSNTDDVSPLDAYEFESAEDLLNSRLLGNAIRVTCD